MTAPGLSVVVATRNRPELLRDAVASIASQEGVGTIEIIVVHDQSDLDHSIADVAPDAQVRVVPNTENVGLAGARNTGIGLASAPFVAFCDDDDVWLQGKAAAQLSELARRPEADLVTTGIVVEYEQGTHPRFLPTDTITIDDLVRDRHTELHPSAFMFRTAALRELGMVSTAVPGGFGEDYELLLRTARRSVIANIPQPFVRIRWHASSYFFERWRMMAEGLGFLVAHYPEFRGDRRGFARIRSQIAFARAAEGRRADGIRGALIAFRSYPLEPRVPLTFLVAARLIKPEWIMVQLHRVGRGI